MKHTFLVILVAFFCVNISFAQKDIIGKRVDQAANGTNEIAQLKKVMTSFDNALMTKNTEELKRVLSDKLSMTHSNEMVETKETLLKNIESERLIYKSIKRSPKQEISVPDAKMILIENYIDVTGILDGAEFSVKLNTKEDWILENGDWKLIRRESKNRE